MCFPGNGLSLSFSFFLFLERNVQRAPAFYFKAGETSRSRNTNEPFLEHDGTRIPRVYCKLRIAVTEFFDSVSFVKHSTFNLMCFFNRYLLLISYEKLVTQKLKKYEFVYLNDKSI